MRRISRSLKKRLEDLRNIPEEYSGSESEENFDELCKQVTENESESDGGQDVDESDDDAQQDVDESDDYAQQDVDESDDDAQQEVDESEDDNFSVDSGDESDDSKHLKTTATSASTNESEDDENVKRHLLSTTDVQEGNSEGEASDDQTDEEHSDAGSWSDDDSSGCETDYDTYDDWVWEVGLDGSVWKKHFAEPSTVKGKISVENILRTKPGPTTYAFRTVSDICSAFRLFVDDNMLDYICECTMKEAQRTFKNDAWKISRNELLAFIAICYSRGSLGLKNMSVTNIFSEKYGPAVIRGTVSRDKFKAIMKFLRFDDKETRKERLATDKFGLMSYVWDSFIDNCQKCYNPGVNVTVDEQLFPTKARCPFTQFMKDKPDKFGIKFFFVVDLRSKYILNGFPFTGKNVQQNDQPAGERVVLRLMEPYFNRGHTVTTDNFFTGLNLAVALKEKKTTLIGTVNKQRRWLPETAKLKNPKLPLYESNIYLGPDATTLTLYQSKRNKSVSILSSLHRTVEITNTEKKKPETITYYNQTKFGVDVADQMAKKYSVKSSSRRWPVQVFYNILDLAAINAWIIYTETTGKKISRLNFITDLAESLRSPYLVDKNVNINNSNSDSSNGMTLRTQNTKSNANRKRKFSTEICCSNIPPKRQHCQTKKCNNKSSAKCYDCKKIICGKCTTYEQRWCVDCCPLMCTK